MPLAERRVRLGRGTLLAAEAVVLVATVVVTAFAAETSARPVFPLLLLGLLLLLAPAAVRAVLRGRVRADTAHVDIATDPGLALAVSSGLALGLMLLVRVASVSHFGGNVADLDAGRKDSGGSNRAFTGNAATFWHCIQGVLVLFLLPVRWPLPAALPQLRLLLELAAPLLAVYPVYNGIKRGVKAGAMFSISSYYNNGSEWAVGLLLGLGLGLSLVAWFPRVPTAAPSLGVCIWRLVFAALQTGAICFAIIFMSVHWNEDSAVGPGDDNAGAALCVVVPVVAFAALMVGYFWACPKVEAAADEEAAAGAGPDIKPANNGPKTDEI